MRLAHGATISLAAALLPGAGAAQTGETYRNPQRTYHDAVSPLILERAPPRDEEDEKPPPYTAACVRVFGTEQCAPPESEVAAQLIARGPAELGLDDLQHPSVVALVRDHWPFVIDFAAEPGTMTVLKVRLYHRRYLAPLPIPFPYLEVALRQVIDIGGGGRRVVVVPDMDFSRSQDAQTGGDVRVARYSIRSYRIENGEPVRSRGRLVRAPVEIFGMGAGPAAVGSMVVRDVQFGPPRLHIPQPGQSPANAQYSFRLDSDFALASATVARCRNLVCTEQSRPIGRILPAYGGRTIQGVWTVRTGATAGDYAMTIRAWDNCRGETNADRIRMCEDEAAWAFGRAKPVALAP